MPPAPTSPMPATVLLHGCLPLLCRRLRLRQILTRLRPDGVAQGATVLGAVAPGATHGGAPPAQGPDVAGSPVAASEPPASGEEKKRTPATALGAARIRVGEEEGEVPPDRGAEFRCRHRRQRGRGS